MSYKLNFNKIYLLLLSLIIFLIPTNLFWIISKQDAYVNGLLIDYLLPKIYLVDLPLVLLVTTWLFKNFNQLKWKIDWKVGLLGTVLVIRQFFTPHPAAGVWYLLKLVEMGFFGWFLFKNQQLLKNTWIKKSTFFTILFQTALATYQYVTQASLWGYLFLGEVDFSHSIGLAKDSWWQTGKILAYGTTSHPNILAGVMVAYTLLLMPKNKSWWLPVILILFLTQSVSAFLALLLGLSIVHFKSIPVKQWVVVGAMVFIMTPLLIWGLNQKQIGGDSISRRNNLQQAAFQMFTKNSILGVGLNQFTSRVEEYQVDNEVVRFAQPVHHVGWLWLAETGLIGILLVGLLYKRLELKLANWVWLIPIISLDHYLISLSPGLLILVFSYGFWESRHPNHHF